MGDVAGPYVKVHAPAAVQVRLLDQGCQLRLRWRVAGAGTTEDSGEQARRAEKGCIAEKCLQQKTQSKYQNIKNGIKHICNVRTKKTNRKQAKQNKKANKYKKARATTVIM